MKVDIFLGLLGLGGGGSGSFHLPNCKNIICAILYVRKTDTSMVSFFFENSRRYWDVLPLVIGSAEYQKD